MAFVYIRLEPVQWLCMGAIVFSNFGSDISIHIIRFSSLSSLMSGFKELNYELWLLMKVS